MARRLLDFVFFIYFLTHIPISLFVDFQALIPSEYYHQQLVDLKTWYCREYRDSMMAAPPSWFKSLIICAKQCRWLRWPCVVYGVHVATTLAPIIGYVLLEDFSKATLPSPRNLNERLTLLGFYSPYLIIPIIIALDALFSSAYRVPSDYRAPSTQKPREKKLK